MIVAFVHDRDFDLDQSRAHIHRRDQLLVLRQYSGSAVTAMTPLEYQKRLRLQEARRLIWVDRLDVGRAGYQVGYQSPSQFSREYSRIFGVPPSRDRGCG